jgi:hypothetical protein
VHPCCSSDKASQRSTACDANPHFRGSSLRFPDSISRSVRRTNLPRRFDRCVRHPEGMTDISPGSRSGPGGGKIIANGILAQHNRRWRCAYLRLISGAPAWSGTHVARGGWAHTLHEARPLSRVGPTTSEVDAKVF